MRVLGVWAIEFLKLLGRQPLYPLNAECPICHQMVRLHYKQSRPAAFVRARSCLFPLAVRRIALWRALCGEDEMFRFGRSGEV